MPRYFKGIPKSAAASSSKPPWRSPDHPPYSQMVEVALRALSEEGGSTESSISAYIQSIFTNLPWGHDRLLPYYLGKLVISGELSSPSQDRYQLPLHRPEFLSAPSLVRRRGRSPLYCPNHLSYPAFNIFGSITPRRRGRSQVFRFRGRSLNNVAEGTPSLHLEHGSVPPRRRRGRPPLQREGSIGRATKQRLVPRFQRSTGSRIRQDGFRIRNLSRLAAFCNDENHGGGKSAALDNPEHFELIHAQSSREKVLPLLSLEQVFPVKGPPSLAPELPENDKGRPFCNADMRHFSPLISTFNSDNKNGGYEIFSLDDHKQPENVNGGEGQAIVAAQLSEYIEGQFSPAREVSLPTLNPVMISSFLDPELSVYGEGKSPQREALPSQVLEQAELGQEQTSPREGRLFLSPEKSENDDHGTRKVEDSHEKRSSGKRTALVALEQEMLVLPPPDGDEIESLVVSSKKKKSRRKHRRLRLWFEG